MAKREYVTKDEFARTLAELHKTTIKDAKFATNAVLDTMFSLLAEGREIQFAGDMTIQIKTQEARKFTLNGQEYDKPAKRKVVIKAGRAFNRVVNE